MMVECVYLGLIYIYIDLTLVVWVLCFGIHHEVLICKKWRGFYGQNSNHQRGYAEVCGLHLGHKQLGPSSSSAYLRPDQCSRLAILDRGNHPDDTSWFPTGNNLDGWKTPISPYFNSLSRMYMNILHLAGVIPIWDSPQVGPKPHRCPATLRCWIWKTKSYTTLVGTYRRTWWTQSRTG